MWYSTIQCVTIETTVHFTVILEAPKNKYSSVSLSTGAFASKGIRLDNNNVEASLLEHLQKWKPFVEKFGLLIIELHTIDAKLTAKNLGKTAATAYDATHGYSDQYILDVDVFRTTAIKAGLLPDDNHFAKFPSSALATVSINLLRGVI